MDNSKRSRRPRTVKRGTLSGLSGASWIEQQERLIYGPASRSELFPLVRTIWIQNAVNKEGTRLRESEVATQCATELLNIFAAAVETGDLSEIEELSKCVTAISGSSKLPRPNPYLLLQSEFGKLPYKKRTKCPTLEDARDFLERHGVEWEEPQVGQALNALGVKYRRKR